MEYLQWTRKGDSTSPSEEMMSIEGEISIEDTRFHGDDTIGDLLTAELDDESGIEFLKEAECKVDGRLTDVGSIWEILASDFKGDYIEVFLQTN